MRGQWHVNNDGEVGKCQADDKCPFESNGGHTNTKKEALIKAEMFNAIAAVEKEFAVQQAARNKDEFAAGFALADKINLARDPEATSEQLLELSKEKNPHKQLWRGLLNNPNTPAEAIDNLMDMKDGEKSLDIASHPNTSVETLEKLLKHEWSNVVSTAAVNPNLPKEKVIELIRQKDPEILLDIATQRQDLDKDMLMELTKSQVENSAKSTEDWPRIDDEVVDVIFSSELLDEDLLRELEKINEAGLEPPYIRENIAESPICPVDLLKKLSTDENWNIRASVARHPKTEAKVLSKLINDKRPEVRKFAEENPNLSMKDMLDVAQRKAKE